MRQTKDSLEFMEKIALLDPMQRTHMRILVEKLLACYLSEDQHAVIVIGSDTEDRSILLTVNCNELEAAVMLSRLQEMFVDMNVADAPPKELMN